MRRHRALILALVFALVSTVIAMAAVLRDSRQEATATQQKQDEETITPIVDFDMAAPSDPKEKALRHARSKLHDYGGDAADAAKFALNENSASVLLDLPVSHGPQEIPLPVKQSDAVVVGEITEARAYLSNDKSNVYSEFTTSLEDVLVNDPKGSLSAGSVIPTERRGGTVKFPSGKKLVRGALGRTMPRAGRRYVLFLKQHEEEQTFSIITGYELRNGKVIPLDGLSKKTPQLAPFAAYKKTDEFSFLSQIREAILKERSGDK